jgi:hypothetical protein
MKMDIIFYLSGIEDNQKQFEEKVISLIPLENQTICYTLNDLSSALRKSMAGQSICVVAVGREKDLQDLLPIKDLLRNSKLILLLPDETDELFDIGHTLYPRYLKTVRSDYSHIAAVLAKMADITTNDPMAATLPEA